MWAYEPAQLWLSTTTPTDGVTVEVGLHVWIGTLLWSRKVCPDNLDCSAITVDAGKTEPL